MRAEIAPDPAELGATAAHGSTAARLEAARGQRVTRVSIAGNRRLPKEELAGHLQSLAVGAMFSPEAVSHDVRELWDSGLVEDVEIDLEDAAHGGGVAVRVLVRERPTVKRVELVGNEALKADDLHETWSAELSIGAVATEAAVQRAAQKLRDKYAEEGYCLAEISSEVVPAKGGEAVVRFRIREGDRPTVRRINFVGNQAVSAEELEQVMLTGKGGLLGSLGLGGIGGPYRRDVLERDVAILAAHYYDKGYLGVVVGTPRVMIGADRDGVEITLPIEEGPRFRIRAVTIEERDDDGRDIEPLGGRRHLREMLRARPGDFFARAELVQDIGTIQTMYRDAGYANVEVPPATDVDAEHRTVDLRVTIRRHRPLRFGRVEIKGNTKTRDAVIRRELEIAEEGAFSETALERSRRRVQALGFFERVDVSTSQGTDAEHLDVTVEIGEKPTGTFQVGAGFSSMESFLFNAQIQQNNLFGTGRSLSLQAQLSGLRQLVDFRFFEPHLAGTKAQVTVSLFDQLRAYEQFSQASKGGSITLGYPLAAPHLYGSLTYTLQHDRMDTGSGSATLAGTALPAAGPPKLALANLWASGITSSVRPSLTYDTRDNQLFPSSGMFLQGSVELASSLLGSENQLVRWRATGRFYHPLNRDKTIVLRLNTEAGLVTSPSPQGVPLFARFFLGGIFDVRGFPLRSLGPRLPIAGSLDPGAAAVAGGATIGGNLMYYQNLELEFPILQAMNLRGVVFTDLGNIWNTERQYCHAAHGSPAASADPCFSGSSLLAMRASWGFGLRWLSPLGPLRFEWGFPFRPLPGEKPSLFEFTIGSAF